MTSRMPVWFSPRCWDSQGQKSPPGCAWEMTTMRWSKHIKTKRGWLQLIILLLLLVAFFFVFNGMQHPYGPGDVFLFLSSLACCFFFVLNPLKSLLDRSIGYLRRLFKPYVSACQCTILGASMAKLESFWKYSTPHSAVLQHHVANLYML